MKYNYLLGEYNNSNIQILNNICLQNENLFKLKFQNLNNEMNLINRWIYSSTFSDSSTKQSDVITNLDSAIKNLKYGQYLILENTILLAYTKKDNIITSYTLTDKALSDYTSSYIVLLPKSRILCISTVTDSDNTDTLKFSAKKYIILKPTPSSAILPIYNNFITDTIQCGTILNNSVISNRNYAGEYKKLPLINNYSQFKFKLWNGASIKNGGLYCIYGTMDKITYSGTQTISLDEINPITVSAIHFYHSTDGTQFSPIQLPREYYKIVTTYYTAVTANDKTLYTSIFQVTLSDDAITYIKNIGTQIYFVLEY